MKNLPRRIFRLKTLFALGFLLAALAALLAVVVVLVNIRGRRAWEAYAAEARQRGVKMSLKELLPAPVPAAENFAAVPLFANLYSEDEAIRTVAQKALTLPDFKGPGRTSGMSEATLIDLPGWQAAFVKSGDLPAAGGDPAADVLQAISRRFGRALLEVAEAENRPHAVFPVKWELGFYAQLPQLTLIQNAARLHQLRLAAHLARKDSAAAYEEFRSLLRLYRALEREPTLISGLVRISVLNFAESAVWDGLVQGRWEDADLAKIQNDLGSFDLLTDCRFGFASERAGLNDIMDRIRLGQSPFPDSADLTAVGQSRSDQLALRVSSRLAGLVAYNQLAINRYHDAYLRRMDAAGARFNETGSADSELDAIGRSPWPKRMFYSLYRLTIPALETVVRNSLAAHTSLQLTRLACALERCRTAEGAYPETLTALVPKYLDALPHDVIDGLPLRYRRTEDGRFLLYSVAMNGKDDGGATGGKKNARDHLDWAWRWPATDTQPRK